jgi:hypothetical protein
MEAMWAKMEKFNDDYERARSAETRQAILFEMNAIAEWLAVKEEQLQSFEIGMVQVA